MKKFWYLGLGLLVFAESKGMQPEQAPAIPTSPFPEMYAQAIEPLRRQQPRETPTSYLQTLPREIFELLKHYLGQAKNFDEAVEIAHGLLLSPEFEHNAPEVVKYLQTKFPEKTELDLIAALDVEYLAKELIDRIVKNILTANPELQTLVNQIYAWASKTISEWVSKSDYENINQGEINLFVALFSKKYFSIWGKSPFDVDKIKITSHDNALQYAISLNNTPVTKLLLALGANPYGVVRWGTGFEELVEKPETLPILQALINAGLDVNTKWDLIPTAPTIGGAMITMIKYRLENEVVAHEELLRAKLKLIQDAMRWSSHLKRAKETVKSWW